MDDNGRQCEKQITMEDDENKQMTMEDEYKQIDCN